MWAAVVVTALITWPVSSDPISHPMPATWVWQVILVAIGTVLAVVPLITELRENSRLEPPAEPAEKIDSLRSSSVL